MKRIYIYLLITALLWSGMDVAMKSISGIFNPIQMVFSRVFAGGLVLLPYALKTLKKRGIKLSRKNLLCFAFLGFLGVPISLCVGQFATVFAPASVKSAIASSNPVFTALFAYIVLREPISKNRLLSLALAVTGIILIISPWNMHLDPRGVLLASLSPITFAIYSVMCKKFAREFGGITETCFCFLFGAVELMILATLTHIPAVANFLLEHQLERFAYVPFFKNYSVRLIPIILYMFVGGTGIAYALYFAAIEKGSVQLGSLVFFLKPILSPILAHVLLMENITNNELFGIIIMIICSLCFSWTDLKALFVKALHRKPTPVL